MRLSFDYVKYWERRAVDEAIDRDHDKLEALYRSINTGGTLQASFVMEVIQEVNR